MGMVNLMPLKTIYCLQRHSQPIYRPGRVSYLPPLLVKWGVPSRSVLKENIWGQCVPLPNQGVKL